MRTTWMALGIVALAAAATAGASATAPAFKDRSAQESYAIGAQTARTLRKDGVAIDSAMLIRGLKDGLGDGKLLMGEKELRAVMSRVQQDLHRNMVVNRRAQGLRNQSEGAALLAEHGHQHGVVTTTSGLQYTVVKTGTGARPSPSDIVQVKFRGTLPDGLEFDASPEGQPSLMVVAQALPGLREALQLMPTGSHWQLLVPAPLGYGERGMGSDIGPHQVLQFDVQLVGINAAPAGP